MMHFSAFRHLERRLRRQANHYPACFAFGKMLRVRFDNLKNAQLCDAELCIKSNFILVEPNHLYGIWETYVNKYLGIRRRAGELFR